MPQFIWNGSEVTTFPGIQNPDSSTLMCQPGDIVELDTDPGIYHLDPYEAPESVEGGEEQAPESTAEQVAALAAQVAALQAEVAPAEPAPESEAPVEPVPEPPAEEAAPA